MGVIDIISKIIMNIKNFYDTNVFFVILGTGIFLLLWDYPALKHRGYKIDKIVTLVMGIIYLILPFALYAISKM
jgi:Ca2+/Na+ antiporter